MLKKNGNKPKQFMQIYLFNYANLNSYFLLTSLQFFSDFFCLFLQHQTTKQQLQQQATSKTAIFTIHFGSKVTCCNLLDEVDLFLLQLLLSMLCLLHCDRLYSCMFYVVSLDCCVLLVFIEIIQIIAFNANAYKSK